MDALKKNLRQLLDGLETITFEIGRLCRESRFDELPQKISERAAIAAAIVERFQNFKIENTSENLKFRNEVSTQFIFIQKMASEIETLLRKAKSETAQSVVELQGMKWDLIEASCMEPKGTRLEAKA